jgi:pyruvate/2-oxoacid:ferredoxin oxidoreductase alpha subunit
MCVCVCVGTMNLQIQASWIQQHGIIPTYIPTATHHAEASELQRFSSESDGLFQTLDGIWTQYIDARPSLIVADYATLSAFDLAEKYDIPIVVHNFGIIRGMIATQHPPP